jgi:putative nucleotidyltransferase with HDIG domain
LWGALAGAAAVGLTYCLAMFVERPFGITDALAAVWSFPRPDEIVMRRMQSEAPGTYTHSLMVAQLGEAAAKAVGADPLLCRVGGLYHDIGKLRRPHCFVENQVGENVHDRLSPQMSALLIVAHVKDGLELGRALRLPQPVLDIIAQHHGTTLIAYFYHRAAQRAAEKAEQERSLQEQALPKPLPAVMRVLRSCRLWRAHG